MSSRVGSPEKVTEEVAQIIAMTAPPGRHAPGTIEVLAHRPEMLATFLPWARVLATQGALPKHDHELLALRASLNCRSLFEWGEHLLFARSAGVTDAEIAGLIEGPAAAVWRSHEAALVRAADELHHDHDISDATWQTLAAHYDAAQLVEVPYVVGQYTMLSMVANGLRTAVPAEFEPLPAPIR
jgi:4-carboxymuconolactone decarboxylase